MVLTFGLCATFAFAQTQTATLRAPQVSKAASTAAQVQNDRSSNYSIFTKDVTLLAVDFHDGTATGNTYSGTGYTTGVVSSGLEAHGQNFAFATWRRIANADSATWAEQTTIYSGMIQRYFRTADQFCQSMVSYSDTAHTTAENGLMLMSMIDQTTSNSGNFNAFIQLNTVDATNADVVDVNLYQWYRKFYDHCYIDYRTSSTGNWTPVEVNVRGVDMDVNDIANGFYTFTLPLAAAHQANLDVRIRYTYIDPLTHAAYGYFWLIDDVSIVAGPQNRLKYYDEEYTEGNYGLIPQGLQVSPAWYTMVKNNGAVPQSNTTITLNHMNADQDVTTPISYYNNGSIAAGADANLVCDPYYWLYYDSLEYRGWYGYAQANGQGHGTANSTLPTATAGTNYVFAALATDSLTHNFDTHYYNVTTLDNTIGAYRWGHDNGVLTYEGPYNYWLFGYVLGSDGNTWYVTEDPDDVDYYAAGYTVTSRFTTGATVPEGWVIRGVELVASSSNNANYHTNGAVIQGKLYQDAYQGGSVGFNEIATGAGTYQVTDADLNDSTVIGRNSYGYRELGEYNTIKIMFPEQPALAANTSYRVGYAISEDSYIALAHECLGSYREASPTRPDRYDTILYFRNDPSTAKYGNRFLVNQYQTYIWDPIRENGHTFASWYVNYNPMIRILVGPEQQVERVNVEIQCEGEEFGSVNYGGQEACGSTVTPVEHSTPVFTLAPEEGCMIAELKVDGVTIEPYDEEEETGDENYEIGANGVGRYAFVNIAGNHTISATFMEDTTTPEPISINDVYSKVRMNLQPNPATSQVVLSVEGVSGMVNCAIIDMSGRVVYTAMVNTENAQVINLNNIAKGAYFVRITNSDFSKVEKLIVR